MGIEEPFSESPDVHEEAVEASSYLQNALPHPDIKNPSIAVICGSGLGGLVDTIQDGPRFEASNDSIPHFSTPTGISPRSLKLRLLMNGQLRGMRGS